MATIPPSKLPRELRKLGLSAAALLDCNNLYGAVEFYESALANGIKPLIGAEVTFGSVRLGIIALSGRGYSNLCGIITQRHLNPSASLLETLQQHSQGIAVLTSDADLAEQILAIVGSKRVWLEIIANRLKSSEIRSLLRARSRLEIKALASWDVRFLRPQDEIVARVLKSIHDKALVANVRLEVKDASLSACLQLEKMFSQTPELLRETLEVTSMVDLDLGIGKLHFPQLERSQEKAFAKLRSACYRALRAKYRSRRAKRRLDKELSIIRDLGFTDYFLIVKDIVDFAKTNGIGVAGRGSGAGSIVAYLLGITHVDPIKERLLFERFLNEHRPDYPDLDIDICWQRRDEVIAYVYRRFGRERTAMVGTHARFELRSAAREVAKVFGLSPYESQALARRLPSHGDSKIIADALGHIRPELPSRTRHAIATVAMHIVGFPHHTSVHCGGIVIADRRLTHYTPLEMAPKGIQITQFDMHAIEKMGLVKIDLLGNRALSIIDETAASIGKSPVNLTNINDEQTAKLLREGRTLSCFQLESPAMRTLLKMLKAQTLDDITLALALVRPGPTACGMKQAMVKERATQIKPSRKGFQCLVYEEDVMRTIANHARISLAQADILRREIKQAPEIAREHFISLIVSAGYAHQKALEIWEYLKRFATYAFSKAHAASYALLAHATAYLKANHPVEFYAAVLRNHAGMYPKWVHVNEARRLGIEILPPDINFSDMDFAVVKGAIRTGLGSIKHLSSSLIEAILSERERRPFESLLDFAIRIRASRDEVTALVASGAFDEIEPLRSGAFATYLAAKASPGNVDQPAFALGRVESPITIRELDQITKYRMQYATLGFLPDAHPLVLFESDGTPASPSQPAGERYIEGLLAAVRPYEAGGKRLYFLTLDNPDGTHECLLPASCHRLALEIGQAYRARARPSRRHGCLSWHINHIEKLPMRQAMSDLA